jgi:hypothetical protein
MNNERKNDLAGELFTDDHKFHDPQILVADGPAAVAATVAVYQDGLDGHWAVNEMLSAADRVVVSWRVRASTSARSTAFRRAAATSARSMPSPSIA